MSVDVKKSIAALATLAALTGGVIEGVKPVEPIDSVAPMEIVAERTETKTVFDAGVDTVWVKGITGKPEMHLQPKRMAIITTQPVHWFDAADSTYKKIDTTVQERAILNRLFGYDYETAFTGDTRALFKNADSPDYKIERGGYSAGYTFLSDTTAVDVKTETTTQGVKQTYTLRDEKAATRLQWLIETEARTMQRVGDGFVFSDDEGNFLWRVEPPRAWDAGGAAVKVAVTTAGDTLTWDVDVKAAKWPVTVDPSTSFFTSTNDCFYRDGTNWADSRDATEATENVWQPAGIYVGMYVLPSTPYHRLWRTFKNFNTASLSDTTPIDSAYVSYSLYHGMAGNTKYIYMVQATISGSPVKSWFNDFTGWSSSGTYSVVKYADSLAVLSSAAGGSAGHWKMNSTGVSAINRAGYTPIVFLQNYDIFNVEVGNGEHFVLGNADSLVVYYLAPYTPVPTAFTLSSPTTTQLSAAWTNHHTTGIDSLFLVTGATAWVKHLEKTDQSTTITGLTPATEYTYKVAVDSTGCGNGYSNADTLSTLANAPTGLVIAEVDSTHVSITFSGGTNPAGTLYAVRDSTTSKWKDATGADTTTKTWRTEAQWEAISLIATKDVIVRIGVVAKNGDGVETAYAWDTQSTNNKKTFTISASTEWHKQAVNAIYTTARGLTSSAITDAASYEIGMSKPSDYQINRAGARFQIPDADSITAANIISDGLGDESTTDFTMNMFLSAWTYGSQPDDDKFFDFAGWRPDGSTYNGTNLIDAWTTNGNYAAGANANTMVVNADGLTALTAAIHDTLGFQFVSSRDVSSTVPSGNEYIGLTTFKLQLTYWDWDHVPSGVTATILAPNQVIISWTDNASTETGFYVVNGATLAVMGDITNANATSDTIYVIPNTIYTYKVLVSGGKIDGEYSSASASMCTDPGTPGTPVLTDLGAGLMKVVIDTTASGNPSDTEYSLMFITSGNDSLWAVADTLNTATHDENSAWGWKTYDLWGAAAGDSIQGQAGRTYTVKAVARTREY